MTSSPKNSKREFARSRPAVVQGHIEVEGRKLEFRDVRFLYKVAAGANGVVFAAHDELLDRPIAIKIWNARGAARSQVETQKIANISHPLFVVTHRYGRSDGGYPFAIMEFVDGDCAKSWLKRRPLLTERLAVWRLYSRALRHLYTKGVLHGDPHLGNVLVFHDEDYPLGIGVKLADTGTSAFWSSREDFERRESRLILEVASLLFHDQSISKLLEVDARIPHSALVNIIDKFAQVVDYLNVNTDDQRRGITASAIAEQVIEVPVFNLDELLNYVKVCPGTTANRLINRLNDTLDRKISDDEVEPRDLTPKARASYEDKRHVFLMNALLVPFGLTTFTENE
jgi:Protein kinase domain